MEENQLSQTPRRMTWLARVGVGLLLLSFVPYLLLLALPFLPLSPAQKSLTAGTFVAVGEVMFWLGALFAGREVALRFREKLSPSVWWRRIRKR